MPGLGAWGFAEFACLLLSSCFLSDGAQSPGLFNFAVRYRIEPLRYPAAKPVQVDDTKVMLPIF
jgi:hypothetical protein